jgi:hypothetical protein
LIEEAKSSKIVAKKKKERFNVTKAVKAASRANIGPVPATRKVPVKKKDLTQKHRPSLEQMLNDTE